MEKNRQELIDNYKAEQRAAKTRKVLNKTRDWGENIAALLFLLMVGLTVTMIGLAVTMICVTLWEMGLGVIIIVVALGTVAVVVWNLVDVWVDSELDKARHRRNKEMRGED